MASVSGKVPLECIVPFPDPFPSGNPSGKTSKMPLTLPLGVFIALRLEAVTDAGLLASRAFI